MPMFPEPCTLTVNALAASPEHAVRILRSIADDMEAAQKRALPLPHFAVVTGSVSFDWKLQPHAKRG